MAEAFLMWFMRPIGEFLGTLALWLGVLGVFFVFLLVYNVCTFNSNKK